MRYIPVPRRSNLEAERLEGSQVRLPYAEETFAANGERVLAECEQRATPSVLGVKLTLEGCSATVAALEDCTEAATEELIRVASVPCESASLEESLGRQTVALYDQAACAPLAGCL